MKDLSVRRSKLETCLSILETLAVHGSLKVTHIMKKANVNCNVLKKYLVFLIKQGAVEEKCIATEKMVYSITEHGLYLIRCFEKLNQMIPTLKNITKTKLTQPERA